MCAHQWVFLPDFFTQLPSVFFPKCPLGYQWPPDFQILGCFPGRASLSFPWHLSLPITPESTWPPGPKALPLPLYFSCSTSVTSLLLLLRGWPATMPWALAILQAPCWALGMWLCTVRRSLPWGPSGLEDKLREELSQVEHAPGRVPVVCWVIE